MEIGKNTKIKLSLESFVSIGATIAIVVTMYLSLKSEIAIAKELPKPVITAKEYELHDKLIKNTIMQTQEDIEKMQKTLDRIEDKVYNR
tara:strand:- start:285 stop:551 length:267 start_codon:yes stop_codon:yes gene_type:complete